MKPKKREPWYVAKNGSIEVIVYHERAGYRVVWYFAGKRERKFFVDGGEAKLFAKEKTGALGGPQPTNATEIGSELDYVRDLKARLGKTPLHVAVDYFLLHNKRQKLEPENADTLFTRFLKTLKDPAAELSKSYPQAVEKYVQPYINDYPGPIHEQAAKEIDRWMRQRTDSAHSRWHFANYLRRFFTWARDVEKALPGGPTEADSVTTPRPKSKAIQIYSPAEVRLFFKFAADEEERALLALGFFGGLRNSEITGEETNHGPLAAESILFDSKCVKVAQKMQHESQFRYAPIQVNGMTWLDHWRGKSGPIVSFNRAHLVIARIVARINAARADDTQWKKMKVKRNGLRRSHISYRMAILKNPAIVAEECNTSPQKIRTNYNHPELESVAHEYFSISRLIALPDLPDPLPSISDATSQAQSAEN